MNDVSKGEGTNLPEKAPRYGPGLLSIVRMILRWCWPKKESGRSIDIEYVRETVKSDGSGTKTRAKISLRDNTSQRDQNDNSDCH